jgi:two-component system chemotaxis response regulator CheY
MRAVIVDDSFAIRMMLSRELKKLGFEVEAFESGDAILAKLTALSAPDIFMVDWVMPGADGLEVVKAVRADSRFSDSYVMMVTSETLDSKVEAAFAAGVDEYMMKPFSSDAIREKLEVLGFAWEGEG